jgi:hypothetical protein
MNTSAFWLSPRQALRVLWGIAAIGMLFERAPWSEQGALAATDGYLGFIALGLWSVTGGDSRWSRTALVLAVVAWLAVMASRLSGLSA